jgi:cytochrome c553
LAGQNPLYFVRATLDYKNGSRTHDTAHGMRAFAKRLMLRLMQNPRMLLAL